MSDQPLPAALPPLGVTSERCAAQLVEVMARC